VVDRSVRSAGKPFPLAPIHTAIVRVSGLSTDFYSTCYGGEALGTACVLGAGIGLLGQAGPLYRPEGVCYAVVLSLPYEVYARALASLF
jgi:hypothetical protein